MAVPIKRELLNGDITKPTYIEYDDGSWEKQEYNRNGQRTHWENSDGDWKNWEYNRRGEMTYVGTSWGTEYGTKRADKPLACQNKHKEDRTL